MRQPAGPSSHLCCQLCMCSYHQIHPALHADDRQAFLRCAQSPLCQHTEVMTSVLYCMQKGEAFLASPAVQEALRNEQGRRCSAQFSYILEGQVPADLEAIFCRGIEWDHGVEHVLLLKVIIHCAMSRGHLQRKVSFKP